MARKAAKRGSSPRRARPLRQAKRKGRAPSALKRRRQRPRKASRNESAVIHQGIYPAEA